MNKKIYLEAPQAELIVVRFEEAILGPSNPNGTEGSTVKDPFGEGWDEPNM